jgi:hypothetical protein
MSYTMALRSIGKHVSDNSKERPVLKITLPEMFNVAVRADEAIIRFREKIMGDVSLVCNSGDICIDQLRGEHISLQCNNGKFDL